MRNFSLRNFSHPSTKNAAAYLSAALFYYNNVRAGEITLVIVCRQL